MKDMGKSGMRIKNKALIANVQVALLGALSVFFFQPLIIYFSNASNFWYEPKHLLPIIAGVSVVVAFSAFIFLWVISKISEGAGCVFRLIAIFGIIGAFIQGNFIPDVNGSLDGTEIDWSSVNISMIESSILWLGILAVFVVFLKKNKERAEALIQYSFVGILAIDVVSLAAIIIVNNGFDGTLELVRSGFSSKDEYVVTTAGRYDFSNENYVIIVLDDFDSQEFNERIDTNIENVLQDFTYFPDTMSVYGHTELSIPQIVSGKKYYNEKPFGEYLREAYDESPLLTTMIKDKWQIGIYTDTIVPSGKTAEYSQNCINTESTITSKRKFIKYNYSLVAYYCSPYLIKRFFWFYPDVIKDTQGIPMDEYDSYYWDEAGFYSNLDINVSEERPVFRLYHFWGMHPPYERFSANGKDYEDRYDEAFAGNIYLIESFINQLKENDIYDNTVIVIMSDHGESADETGNWKQNPLLLIKGYGEKHAFETSDNRISYGDIQEIFKRLLEGKDAVTATDILKKDEQRVFLRYFIDDAEPNKREESYFTTIHEYVSSGSADDMSAFEDTNKYYSHQ